VPPQGTAGVGGTSDLGYGVVGSSTSNYGVVGISNSNSNAAVLGLNGFPGAGPAGPGVVGFSGTGTGVGGGSGTGIGFGGIAVGAGGIGVAGQATDASGYAGVFTGGKGVFINGTLTLNGSKSAAVRGADGALHRLYCVESPEAWFEDFGQGQLSNGSATVHLEAGFAGVVKTDDYHVFLTPRGEPKGPLYVSNVTPSSFVVHEVGGTSNIAFDYRIVAKRKDIEGKRLEHVDEPPTIDLSKLTEPPAIPATPPGHGH
jgi:hypothetical protein